MVDFKNELSNSQFKAVTYMDGPELVIAGAGSGKTRVLTYKIAYLLEKGIQPNRILALTFTNKAAKEMKKRIASLVSSESASKIQMGTFHSIFAKILRIEINGNKDLLPYTDKFTIYDTKDSETVIGEIVEQMELDEKIYQPEQVMARISFAKDNMIGPDQYIQQPMYKDDKMKGMARVCDIYKEYTLALKKSNAMDFDDLLFNIYILFSNKDDVRRKYSNLFMYCLVDEYQDTNHIQKEILTLLTKERNMLCAVGDDAQSIYAFRGAVIGNILNFSEDFPGAVTFKLEENYRSTKTIVGAANSIIQKNKHQIYKELYSNNIEGEKIIIFRASDDTQEAAAIVNIIKEQVCSGKRSFDDYAIIYRQHRLSRAFESRLYSERIPHRIYGGTSFYQRKEVKDLLAYFRVVVNPEDEQALRRIINYPARGIGNATIAKLVKISILTNKALWEVISRPHNLNSLSKGTATKIIEFVRLVKSWQACASEDAYTLASRICKESGMMAALESSDNSDDGDRAENIYQVLAAIKEFIDEHKNDEEPAISLEDYIREVALLTDDEQADKKGNIPCVKLMTVHASKGLEFSVVFVVGMDSNVFPNSKSYDSDSAFEEERRLFYVAITRAKEQCYLTGAASRFFAGKYQPYQESEFIGDIDKQFTKK